jgi:hypothetical protein
MAAKRKRRVGIERRKELNDERSRNVYENKERNDALPENKVTFLHNYSTFYTNARVFSRIRRPYSHFQSTDAGIKNVQTRFAGIPAGAGVMARNAQGEMCNGPRARRRVIARRAIGQRPPRITHDNKDGYPNWTRPLLPRPTLLAARCAELTRLNSERVGCMVTHRRRSETQTKILVAPRDLEVALCCKHYSL